MPRITVILPSWLPFPEIQFAFHCVSVLQRDQFFSFYRRSNKDECHIYAWMYFDNILWDRLLRFPLQQMQSIIYEPYICWVLSTFLIYGNIVTWKHIPLKGDEGNITSPHFCSVSGLVHKSRSPKNRCGIALWSILSLIWMWLCGSATSRGRFEKDT